MTHDEIAREFYQKDKGNSTPVGEYKKSPYASDYYCRYCLSPVHEYGVNYCYNCGKKLNWGNIIKLNYR